MCGVPGRCADYWELCPRRDIDLLSVVTTESTHREPVLAPPRSESTCLEKPIATSVGDAERMIEATARAGAFLMVGHVLLFENTYATVKRWISEGRLGKVSSIHARHNRPKSQYRLY